MGNLQALLQSVSSKFWRFRPKIYSDRRECPKVFQAPNITAWFTTIFFFKAGMVLARNPARDCVRFCARAIPFGLQGAVDAAG
jgi:hypothetical protein